MPCSHVRSLERSSLARQIRGGGSNTTKVSAIAIAAADDKTSIAVGDTLVITASVLPDNASNKAVEWTVTTVEDTEAANSIDAAADDATEGTAAEIADATETTDEADATDTTETDAPFTYASSDDTLTLNLRALAAGKISVQATAKDGSAVQSNTLVITVTEESAEPGDETDGVTSVSISSSSASIQYDGTADLTATPVTTSDFTLVYTWEITSGSDYATLSDSDTNTVTLTANNTTSETQTVKVIVTATDSTDETKTATSEEFEITISAHGVEVKAEVTAVSIVAANSSIATVGTTTLTATPVSTGSPSITYVWEITSGEDYAVLSESDTSTVMLTGKNGTKDAQTVTVTVTAKYTVDGEDKSVPASEPVSVTVAAKTLTKIEVDTSSASATKSYTVGDTFSSVGLVVTATYSDGATADVSSSANYSGYDLATAVSVATEQPVTVTYTDDFGTQTTTFSITVSPKPEASDDVYAYSASDTIINLGKTNIDAKAYLKYAKAEYNASTQTINEVTDYYANLSKTEREIDITVSGVAAFTLYVQNATAGRTFTVQIGNGTAYTVTHPGSQTIDNVSLDIASFTFNTGTTQKTTIKISGGGETVTPGYVLVYNQAQTISATSVTIAGAPTSALVLTDYPSGTTYNSLTATVAPAWCTNGTVSWSSSNTAVATINASTGAIQPLTAGTTTITATVGTGTDAVTDDFELSITDTTVAVTGVTLNNTSASLARWATLTLEATVAPSNATNKNLSWSSATETVATVENGVVTAVAPGTAIITVTTEDGSKTAECTVTVTPVYVSAGEYALLGAETATTEAPWTAQSALTSQALNNIHTTTAIDDTGFLLKSSIDTTGYAEFALKTEMKVTIDYTVLKAASKTGGIVLTTADGSFTSDSDSTATIYTNQTDIISSGDTNSKAAFQTLDSDSETDKTESFVITLGAGNYKLYGYKKATSTRASKITFARTTTENAKGSATVATEDISLTASGATVRVTLPTGVTATAYAWYLDGSSTAVSGATSSSYTLPASSTVGKTYIITAEVTINGKKYTKTTSVTYTGTSE